MLKVAESVSLSRSSSLSIPSPASLAYPTLGEGWRRVAIYIGYLEMLVISNGMRPNTRGNAPINLLSYREYRYIIGISLHGNQ